MDTVKVNIHYRPLRIGWAIKAGDFESFRKAVRYSYALWGGRFNPIIIVDNKDEATALVECFGVDFIVPLGGHQDVVKFVEDYPHLINPFLGEQIFIKGGAHQRSYSCALDIHNLLSYHYDKTQWMSVKDRGVHIFSWEQNDPLADVLLSQLGGYPDPDEVGTDYRKLVTAASEAIESAIGLNAIIPVEAVEFPGIQTVSRLAIDSYNFRGHSPQHSGFFVGSATDLDDLVCHWNLRAADIGLWFIDRAHLGRYAAVIPKWHEAMAAVASHYADEWDRRIGLWMRGDDLEKARGKPFDDMQLVVHRASGMIWNGLNVHPPMMHFGRRSAMGLLGDDGKRPRVSFSLPDKPFADNPWFLDQHLVASVSFIGGLYGDELNILQPPYIPELNEFYARKMHFYDELRIEPESIALIIDAVDTDNFLNALPVGDLVARLFEIINYDSEPSSAGLIARQLLTRLGGVHGADVFKIPGVRRLLSTYRPNDSFKKRSALQLIGARGGGGRPNAAFSDYADMHLERRGKNEKLTQDATFGYMVEKGLFRVGAKLLCPSCQMPTWYSLGALQQKVACDLCGHSYDASRQLVDTNELDYRRSGILGREKNAQGAVPVLMTLGYLKEEFSSMMHGGFYSLSLNLTPTVAGNGPTCETDFVWVEPRQYPDHTGIALAECKDQGAISATDIENLKQVVDAFPRRRFDTYVILAKIAPFTDEEIELAKTLNGEHRHRAILLSGRELELDHLPRLKAQKSEPLVMGHSLSELAHSTANLYFKPRELKA